jgi:hypothetical protein
MSDEQSWRMRVFVGDLDGPDLWLRSVDVEARGGRGTVDLTADPAEAMRFPSLRAVMQAWRQPSRTTPFRDDGKPNRPLTAYSISPERVP